MPQHGYNDCVPHSIVTDLITQHPELVRWSIGVAVFLFACFAVARMRTRRDTPESREKARRERLNLTGRITACTVIDAHEAPATRPDGFPAQLVVYRYDVAGVSYEASQDVTALRQYVDLHTCRIGLPASVKYDSANPANSIVICEQWNGLRNAPAKLEL